MKRAFLLAMAAVVCAASSSEVSRAAAADQEQATARGQYLVMSVAMCVQCHSPRDGAGNLLPDKLLHGGPIPFRSPYRNEQWALTAPAIAGLPGRTDEDVITLLMTGKRPQGDSPA